jgi:hypothetical protein
MRVCEVNFFMSWYEQRNRAGDMNYFFYVGILLVSGCSITIATTENNATNNFSVYNNKIIYQTQKDLFLVKDRYILDNKSLMLCRPADSRLPSIEEYIKHAWSESDARDIGIEIIDIIPSGLEFTVAYKKTYQGLNWWYGTHKKTFVYGKIAGGKYDGYIFNITEISYVDGYPLLNSFVKAVRCINDGNNINTYCSNEQEQGMPGTDGKL